MNRTPSSHPSPPLGEKVPGGRLRGIRTGSGSQCMRKSERGLSMNRPGHRIVAWLGKAALKTHALQTLRDCRASPNRAKRLECVRFIGAFRRARDGPRFMVPMHGHEAEGALYEPTHARPLPGGEIAFVCVVSVPLLGGRG